MKSGIEYMTLFADWYPKSSKGVLVSSKLVVVLQEIFQFVWFLLYQDMEMHDVPFGVISVKFQIQQPVTVRILEQFQMKKLLGVN
jgi:hypothetical protein